MAVDEFGISDDDENEALSKFSEVKKKAEDVTAKAWDTISRSYEGIDVLKDIYQMTEYDAALIRYDPRSSEMNPYATMYNNGRRSVWLEIRAKLTPEQRSLIESEDRAWERKQELKAQAASELAHLMR
jgi:hypothetical protein